MDERALLWEAWATSLDNPDWAESVRNELDFLTPVSARDMLSQLLSRGPNLYGAWQQWREAVRQQQSPETVERLFEQGRHYLNPAPDFAAHWQRVRQHAHHFRSRNVYIQVDASLLRSPQPRLSGLTYLKQTYGLTGLINLREESEESRQLCEQAGVSYTWIAVEDEQTPKLPQVEQFLEATRHGVNLVHCFAGQGRTGLFVAAYRTSKGIPLEEAIARTDAEVFSRGMRDGQRQWLRENWPGWPSSHPTSAMF